MEKENVLEIEITKINDDWSAITVKKLKKILEITICLNGLILEEIIYMIEKFL